MSRFQICFWSVRIRGRRPLNSRERSIGRAHLLYCPRLRRMTLAETVQIANSRYQRPSRVARQVIGPRIPRSWLEHLDDASLDVIDTAEIESWVSQDVLKKCNSVEPVSHFGPVSDWDDRNCLGRRQCSIHARMCSPPNSPSRAQRRLETYMLVTSSFSAFCNSQTYMSIRRPSKCRAPMLCTTSGQMPTNAGKAGSTLAGEFWGGRLDGVSGTLAFPLGRRVSLMLITMLVAAVGVNRTLLQRLLGGWAFALAFRRLVSASFCSRHFASKQTMPSERSSSW